MRKILALSALVLLTACSKSSEKEPQVTAITLPCDRKFVQVLDEGNIVMRKMGPEEVPETYLVQEVIGYSRITEEWCPVTNADIKAAVENNPMVSPVDPPLQP